MACRGFVSTWNESLMCCISFSSYDYCDYKYHSILYHNINPTFWNTIKFQQNGTGGLVLVCGHTPVAGSCDAHRLKKENHDKDVCPTNWVPVCNLESIFQSNLIFCHILPYQSITCHSCFELTGSQLIEPEPICMFLTWNSVWAQRNREALKNVGCISSLLHFPQLHLFLVS